jgi:hypothetical protein
MRVVLQLLLNLLDLVPLNELGLITCLMIFVQKESES